MAIKLAIFVTFATVVFGQEYGGYGHDGFGNGGFGNGGFGHGGYGQGGFDASSSFGHSSFGEIPKYGHHAHAPAIGHYAVPVAKKVIVEEPAAPAHYDYAYGVNDPHTGDSKSQHESRRGDVVKGVYSVVDADGSKRTVEYTADAHNGFNAIVHREPPAHPVKTVAKYAAPVVSVAKYAAPVAKYAAPAISYGHAAPAISYGHAAPAPSYHAAAPAYSTSSYSSHEASYGAPIYHH